MLLSGALVEFAGGGIAGDFIPQCNQLNPAANGECGVYQDLNFGQLNPRATRYDQAVLTGFRHRNYPAFCVQYHPEAAPGPHDSHYLFGDFVKLMEEQR